ncbi:hypothetical protein HanXRQr2_Chr02g0048181 [Helianthus annuus]|uniref:Uncharacterized protein n=1 Tax=Helianthus annuus TaxID=4232 RepID=A0A9K3JJZ4_HELAN|nr:hypothetical protein HanXRQr2_Chr02g0048181 [Helianthus annuus]KAJ0950369.1 hypothetical protein HanPSC8_Chr02g0047511 [Helianthus annuus]
MCNHVIHVGYEQLQTFYYAMLISTRFKKQARMALDTHFSN